MPSWRLHEKWCQSLGISKEVCREVNKIIDDPSHHDIVNKILRWGWARDAFESGKIIAARGFMIPNPYGKVVSVLDKIVVKFGKEGIKATFNHIALDRIAELRKRGFGKEEIKKKLVDNNLIQYITDYDCVFEDIAKEVKPEEKKIKQRTEFEEIVKKGVRGVFYIDGRPLPGPAGLWHIYSRVKKGETVYVKWGYYTEDARRGKIKKFVHNERDLEDLISLIKQMYDKED